MPSVSNTWHTVDLPEPMPPVIPTLSIGLYLAGSCCCSCCSRILLTECIGHFHRYCRAFNDHICITADLYLQGTVFIGAVDTAVDACCGNYLLTCCDAIRKFLLLLCALSLRTYHKEVHHS